MKFECKGYGDCCRNLKQKNSERMAKFSSVNVLNLAVSPDEIGLPLFDWEADAIGKVPGERYISIKPLWFVVSSKNTPVVVMWHLDHRDCPFLEENRCTIYDKRPEICRSFPVTSSGVIQASRGVHSVKVGSSTACRCWSERIQDLGTMTVSDMYAKFYEIFGSSYLAALKYDMQFVFVAGLLQRLVDAGKINPAYIDLKHAEKILTKGRIGFVDFLEKEKIITGNDIEIRLDDIDKKARNLVGLS